MRLICWAKDVFSLYFFVFVVRQSACKSNFYWWTFGPEWSRWSEDDNNMQSHFSWWGGGLVFFFCFFFFPPSLYSCGRARAATSLLNGDLCLWMSSCFFFLFVLFLWIDLRCVWVISNDIQLETCSGNAECTNTLALPTPLSTFFPSVPFTLGWMDGAIEFFLFCFFSLNGVCGLCSLTLGLLYLSAGRLRLSHAVEWKQHACFCLGVIP